MSYICFVIIYSQNHAPFGVGRCLLRWADGLGLGVLRQILSPKPSAALYASAQRIFRLLRIASAWSIFASYENQCCCYSVIIRICTDSFLYQQVIYVFKLDHS